MWRKAMPVLGLMPLCMGCAGKTPRLEALPCPVPAYQLECLAEPGVPDGHGDLEAAMYLVDTRAAGADCRSKLQAVREMLGACRADYFSANSATKSSTR